MSNIVRAIALDLWDTVLVDDSDEPKRQARGLPSKHQERRDQLWRRLNHHEPIDQALVETAYDTADAAFNRTWKHQCVTWTVRQRLEIALKGLGRQLPEQELVELVRWHEEMELRVQPDLVPGIAKAIQTLAERYTLVVISDAIFSSGRALRELLRGHGLTEHFAGFVFSDEVGRSKPDPVVFRLAAGLAECEVGQLVMVGDREYNDVLGAKSAGAWAVLFTAVKDRGSDETQADAVCAECKRLPGIIDALSTGAM
jgi:putative hydrolase of the HAD superfamily